MEEKPLALRWDERLMVIGSIMEVICCLYEGTKRAGNRVTHTHTHTQLYQQLCSHYRPFTHSRKNKDFISNIAALPPKEGEGGQCFTPSTVGNEE